MPKVSVCIPVYNSGRYLRECIDSVLSQTFTDFELLIVDDGSTDDSCDIISSYSDSRIRLLHNDHDYIATINMLIDNARGEYVARMDSDDRMLPTRLQTQVEILDNHKEIDILGGGFVSFGRSNNSYIPSDPLKKLSIADFVGGNRIANPTVMMRRCSVVNAGLRYEHEFIYAEDLRFWLKAIEHGLYVANTDKLLIEYRSYGQQVSSSHSDMQKNAAKRATTQALKTIRDKECGDNSNYECFADSGNNLTVIMPFLNEGDEVIRTVKSIRETAGNSVDIIAINDCSFDGYDYRASLEGMNVNYVFNEERLGVAESRNLGVRLCRTSYFLLLDAHMRFYDGRWQSRIVSKLEEDDRVLLCCQTKALEKDADGNVVEATDAGLHFGAYMPLRKGKYLPDIKWNNTEMCPDSNEEDIPFVLGAGYAASKRYWQYLRGLNGLKQYGSDEAYISMKVWLEGGRCILLKDVVIGHIYRTAFPYTNNDSACVYNELLVASLLFPEKLKRRAFDVARSLDAAAYEGAEKMLKANVRQTEEMKRYYQRIFKRPFRDMIAMHRIAQPEDIDFMEKYCHTLPDIASTLADNIHGYGIAEGKMGAAIWFYEYSHYSGENQWHGVAEGLLQDVLKSVGSRDMPLDFDEGLSGIGWGLAYIEERGFTNIDLHDAMSHISAKLGGTEKDDLPLSIGERFDITRFIPRNPKRWVYSMNGILGTSLEIMEISRLRFR